VGEDTKELVHNRSGLWLFCDGGLLTNQNPNPNGATGAFIITMDGVEVDKRSYASTVGRFEQPISGNDSELEALSHGLLRCDELYPGTPVNIGCDSGVTLQRLVPAYLGQDWNAQSCHPFSLFQLNRAMRDTVIENVVLISGHPTQKRQKASWVLDAHGAIYGLWEEKNRFWHSLNIECDDMCKEEKDRWKRENAQ
jgi:ribonuclease HI